MSISPTHSQASPERGLALQKYLLLHSQHDALQKHLSQISSSVPNTNITSSTLEEDRLRSGSFSSSSQSTDDEYLSSSPSSSRNTQTLPLTNPTRPLLPKRRSSLPTILAPHTINEIANDELALKSVNHQIKSTLTDLLNCESVRRDTRYRMWVQTRLMDAERELKDERSRSCGRNRRRSVDVNGGLIMG